MVDLQNVRNPTPDDFATNEDVQSVVSFIKGYPSAGGAWNFRNTLDESMFSGDDSGTYASADDGTHAPTRVLVSGYDLAIGMFCEFNSVTLGGLSLYWAVADGTSGTVDRRGRFAITADGVTYIQGTTGGAATVNIAHTHAAGTYTQPTHTHGGGTYGQPNHQHGAGSYAGPNHQHAAGGYAGPSHFHGAGSYTGPSHTHDLASHSHPFTSSGTTGTESADQANLRTISPQEAAAAATGHTHTYNSTSNTSGPSSNTSGAAGTGAIGGSSSSDGTGAVSGSSGFEGTGAVSGTSSGAGADAVTGSSAAGGADAVTGSSGTGGSAAAPILPPWYAVTLLQRIA